MVLRRADVTDIRSTATGEFQKGLLIAEQLLQQVPFASDFDLRDWKSILSQFSRQYKLILVEDECPEVGLFLIGEIEKITRSTVYLRYFSGAGNWDDKPTKLALSCITSCQVDTNYLNVYQRHFERTKC